MAAWIPQPVMFESDHDFDCDGFDSDQCLYYKERWHNWYVADWTFALPTVAFFICTIGIFMIAYILTQLLSLCKRPGPLVWQRSIAATRYLSYRGFHVKVLGWNSAPIGILFLGATGTAYFLCMDLAPSPYYWPGTDAVWGNSPPLGTRSGWLALACLPFVFATASKASWVTLVTGVTHEKLQIFHRWISYAFFVLALMHTFPFIVWHISNGDMVDQFTASNVFEYWTGIVALLAQAWLTFASASPIRNLGYEFFKASHFLAAITFIVVFFWHCGGTLTSWDYFVATAAVYVPCLFYGWIRTLCEYGVGQKAQVTIEENGFIRLTVPANFDWTPGQHCFLRFPGFGIHALSSHPFTICSLPSTSRAKPSEMTFFIRHRGGFTARLYKYALTRPGARVPVFVDGPYGGVDNQKYFSSDRLVVIAGGSGVGWMLPFVEQFLQYSLLRKTEEHGYKDNPEERAAASDHSRHFVSRGPQHLRVILATREAATRAWLHSAVDNLLSEYQSSGSNITIQVHLTGKAELAVQGLNKTASELEESGSSSAEEAPIEKRAVLEGQLHTCAEEEVGGRPDVPSILQAEAAAAAKLHQRVGVFVCGPITMQNDARNAVAAANLNILWKAIPGGMYLHLEHFSWA